MVLRPVEQRRAQIDHGGVQADQLVLEPELPPAGDLRLTATAEARCAKPATETASVAISPRRRRLSDDSVASLMCLKSWQSSGIIEIDKSLFERAIEAAAAAEDGTPAPGLIATQ